MPGVSSRSRTEVLLFLLAAATLAAGEDLSSDLPKALRVGFAAWGGGALEARDEYLRASLPLELRDRLSGAGERELADDERRALAASLARKRAQTLSTQLRDAARARDEVLFKALPEDERAKALAPLEARRRELLEALLRMEQDLPHLQVLPRAIPLLYEPADLIEAPRYSVAAAGRKAGVDLIVWGRLEPLEGHLYWRVGCHSVLLDRELFAVEDVSSPQDIAAATAKAVAGLAEALLGRPWSSLTVASVPPGSRVRVDGRPQGIGPVDLRFLTPGPHEIEVSLEGYRTYTTTVFLEPFARQTVEATLEPLDARTVRLSSAPAGALVYRDSLYVGATPLDLALPPAGVVTYRLVADGYFDRYQSVDAAGPSSIEATLRRRLVDPSEWQEVRRRRFFRSLGAFALSIPIPIVSYAIALDSGLARQHTAPGTDEYDTLTRRAVIGTALWAGGIFASVVLGINMAADLREYIRYADDPAF